MRRITAAAVVTGTLLGCAGTHESRPDPGVAERVQELETERERVEQERQEQAQRIRELETQLGLAQARVRELRDGRWETVRIREDEQGQGEPKDPAEQEQAQGPRRQGGWNEPSSDRPVLRLRGTSSGSGGGSGDEEPLPPVPTARPGFDTLPVAPLPDEGELRAAMREPAADGGGAEPERPEPARGGGEASSDEAVASYRAALAMVRDRRFGEALEALDEFVRRHPEHPYADNALYWRGEVLYAQRRYRAALASFGKVAEGYPSGNKVSDALLKMALCHKRMGELRKARGLFERLRREHPDSLAARIASGEESS